MDSETSVLLETEKEKFSPLKFRERSGRFRIGRRLKWALGGLALAGVGLIFAKPLLFPRSI